MTPDGSSPESAARLRLEEARAETTARLAERRAELEELEARELVWANTSAAVLLGALLWAFLSALGILPGSGGRIVLGAGALLVPLVLVRRLASTKRKRCGYAVDWNERARQRLDERFAFGQPDGREFTDRKHAFSYDLGLFGPDSLFHRVNACHTALGRGTLAEWLQDASARPPAEPRAQAIRELRTRGADRELLEIELRTLSEAGSRHPPEVLAQRTRDLVAWGATPAPDERDTPLHTGLLVLLPLLAVTGVVLSVGLGSWWWAVIPFVGNALYARSFRDLGPLTGRFEAVADTLGAWSRVLEQVAALRFQTPLLTRLLEPVTRADSPAPAAVAELRRQAHRLAQRQNAFWAVTGNIVLLTDLWARRALLRWQRQHGPELAAWTGAVAGLEALLSLASYADAVPDHGGATVGEDGPLFEASALAHPLLPRERRVANDVRLEREGVLVVVTGSNMSGKSTYLRAVGLATVLVRAGLPVPAASCRMRCLSVVTSMNVEDSLGSGLSRFHAEVRRLRFCLDRAAENSPTLVLLDEILGGTNSRERHTGTEAVLRQLSRLPTATLVSTHDLSLASLANDPEMGARVVHFTDEVRDGVMTFDYRLREGPLPSTNALEVMRLEGIEVEDR